MQIICKKTISKELCTTIIDHYPFDYMSVVEKDVVRRALKGSQDNITKREFLELQLRVINGVNNMTRIMNEAAQVARIIKAKLKSQGIKCTARSDIASVRITLQNQPPWTMRAIKEHFDKHCYGTFDTMTDCSGIKNGNFKGPQTEFLQYENEISKEIKEAARVELEKAGFISDDMAEWQKQKYLESYLREDHRRCYFKKPRMAA